MEPPGSDVAPTTPTSAGSGSGGGADGVGAGADEQKYGAPLLDATAPASDAPLPGADATAAAPLTPAPAAAVAATAAAALLDGAATPSASASASAAVRAAASADSDAVHASYEQHLPSQSRAEAAQQQRATNGVSAGVSSHAAAPLLLGAGLYGAAGGDDGGYADDPDSGDGLTASSFVDDGMGTYRTRPPESAFRSSCGSACDRRLPVYFGRPMLYGFARNLWAGVGVAILNVPLSIALAIASNCPPVYGVVTAFWAGLIGSIAGGSHFNVLGLSGALAGVLASYARAHGPEALPWLAMMAGLLSLVVFSLDWHRYITFLPGFVTHGFTLGVAAVIVGGQLGAALGLVGLTEHERFVDNVGEQLNHLGDTHWASLALFLGSWLVLFVCTLLWPRLPWTVVVAAAGTLLGYLSEQGQLGGTSVAEGGTGVFETLGLKYGSDVLAPDLFAFQPSPHGAPFLTLLSTGCSVTFVGILETLISGKIADRLALGGKSSGARGAEMNDRREVFGLGVANFFTGLFGGAPASGFVGRMQIFLRGGGHSRVGVACSAVVTLFLVVLVFPIFEHLPTPTVAALLVQVAVSMVEHRAIGRYWALDRVAFALTLVVALVCIVWDPTTGIVVGTALGLVRFAESVSGGHSELTVRRGDDALLVMSGESLDRAQTVAHSARGWCSRTTCHAVFAEPTYTSLGVAALDDDEQRAVRVAQAARQVVAAAAAAAAKAAALAAAGKPLPAVGSAGSSSSNNGNGVSAAEDGSVAITVQPSSSSMSDAAAADEADPAVAAARAARLLDEAAAVEGSVLVYRLVGKLSYIDVHHHVRRLQKLAQQGSNYLIVSFEYLYLIDVDGIEALETVELDLRARHKQLLLSDIVSPVVWATLLRSAWFQHKHRSDRLVFATATDALRWARRAMARDRQVAAQAVHADLVADTVVDDADGGKPLLRLPRAGADGDGGDADGQTPRDNGDAKSTTPSSRGTRFDPRHPFAGAAASSHSHGRTPQQQRTPRGGNTPERGALPRPPASPSLLSSSSSAASANAPSSVLIELAPPPAKSLDELVGSAGVGRTRRQQILYERELAAAQQQAAAAAGAVATPASDAPGAGAAATAAAAAAAAAPGVLAGGLVASGSRRSSSSRIGAAPSMAAPQEADEDNLLPSPNN